MTVEKGDGPVNLKIHFKNFDFIGLSSSKFTKIDGFKREYDKNKIELRFVPPIFKLVGPYKMDGKILLLPAQGNGIANITFGRFS